MSDSLSGEDLMLLMSFDAVHLGKTAQLAAYTETLASLANQPFMQAKFIDEAAQAYKCPMQEEVAAYLSKKAVVEAQ